MELVSSVMIVLDATNSMMVTNDSELETVSDRTVAITATVDELLSTKEPELIIGGWDYVKNNLASELLCLPFV